MSKTTRCEFNVNLAPKYSTEIPNYLIFIVSRNSTTPENYNWNPQSKKDFYLW